MGFRLSVNYRPRGDQVAAIEELVRGAKDGEQHQVLLGVTGSGKTFTMAKVIEAVSRPALILAHNKTLAAQLYHEFRTFFPDNAVEYFVSYYDYYQPEAYMPASDVYIEKEATINEELDKLRLSATRSLFERRDCVIVASVSCIYGLGSPEAYYGMLLMLEKGQKISRQQIISRLVDILYDRSESDFRRGTFRVRGDVIEVSPTYDDNAYRIELWGDEIQTLAQIDPLLGQVRQTYLRLPIYPKTHYVMSDETRLNAMESIKTELEWWRGELEKQGRLIEAQRLHQRTMFDLEMMREVGYCHGIENYSRHFSGRLPGEAPPTLLDYLPHDALIFLDESHQTVPQLHGMYHGDRSRKEVLVAHGFRLPSALDNRPLTFEEFEHRVNQVLYVSATPGPYELTKSAGVVVEQIIRPTGLLDPTVEVRPVRGQVDDLLGQIRNAVSRNQRVLVTTLTKRMAEDLAEYYSEVGVRCRYLHSEVSTLDRVKILRDLRRGEFDVLVGINLLREGLDLPEVALVAVLDADKEGFLRSSGSLIQTMGRAARHVEGRAVLYADVVTDSMRRAMDETSRRRRIQLEYNERNGIVPQSIIKPIDMSLVAIAEADYVTIPLDPEDDLAGMPPEKREKLVTELEERMREAARKFEFDATTAGQVALKWYLGGIAGDELAAVERIGKGQLDGAAGASFCERLGPSLKVTRIVGLFQDRDETRYVITRLRPTLDAEYDRKGFVNLGVTGFGNAILFSRTPVRSMDELRTGRYFVWDLDDVWVKLFPLMGVHTVPLPVTEAARAYDEGRTDGFIVIPSGALAFQWSTRARYYSDLRAGFLPACVTIARRAFDALPLAHQQAIRGSVAKFMVRFEDVGRATDGALLGGLFERQGLKAVPVSPEFRAAFLEQARTLRDKTQIVSPEILAQVQGWLADYRFEHRR